MCCYEFVVSHSRLSCTVPENRLREEMLVKLAVALYAQDVLSFGQARELAELSKYEFGRVLGNRQIARHYGTDELEDDLVPC